MNCSNLILLWLVERAGPFDLGEQKTKKQKNPTTT